MTGTTISTEDGDRHDDDEIVADPRYQRLLLGVVMLAVMAFGSLMTIVTVSLDEIADELGSTRSTLTWMITGLMVAMAVCTPPGRQDR